MKPRENRETIQFFGLVLMLSLPFYALGISGAALPFACDLPISALMAVVPMIAALGLVAQKSGPSAAAQLFNCAFNFRRIPSLWWVLAAISIMPISFALTVGSCP